MDLEVTNGRDRNLLPASADKVEAVVKNEPAAKRPANECLCRLTLGFQSVVFLAGHSFVLMCAFLCNQIWPRPSCVAAVPMRFIIYGKKRIASGNAEKSDMALLRNAEISVKTLSNKQLEGRNPCENSQK
jgi:hypothetical protein